MMKIMAELKFLLNLLRIVAPTLDLSYKGLSHGRFCFLYEAYFN